MKKMLVLTLMLSAMAVGSAMANDVTSSEVRGPKRVNINIVAPKPKVPMCCDHHHKPVPKHRHECCHHNGHRDHGKGLRSYGAPAHRPASKEFRPGNSRPLGPADRGANPNRGYRPGVGHNRK